MAIVSASRRTDIPALYPDWLVNRLRAGFALVPNPFNPRSVRRVDLTDPTAIVFWTKSPGPLIPHLPEIDRHCSRYLFHYTITGLPDTIEPRLPPLNERIGAFQVLSKTLGPERVIWRFDPILICKDTDARFVVETFRALSDKIAPYTKLVIVSFAVPYRKVVRNLPSILDIRGDEPALRALASDIAGIAREHGLAVGSCAEALDLSAEGIVHARCIDADLIGQLFYDGALGVAKDPSQRKACGCAQSADIGMYDSCTHGCLYCYANASPDRALVNRTRHDPSGESLLKYP